MRLEDVLNKFSNDDFLISVNGWCSEMGFWEYEAEKEEFNSGYWYFKDREVLSMSILMTNEMPELCITIEE